MLNSWGLGYSIGAGNKGDVLLNDPPEIGLQISLFKLIKLFVKIQY
jgi:hypothetical protein